MSGPKRNPDKLNTIGIVVVGICGAVLVYVTITALQAFYMNDTSEIQTMADYSGQDQTAKSKKTEEMRNITETASNGGTSGTFRIKIDDAIKLVVEDAKKDPTHLTGAALPPSTTESTPPIFGRPKLGGAPAPAAPADGAGSAAPAGAGAGAGSGSGSAAPAAPGGAAGSAAPQTPTGSGQGGSAASPSPANAGSAATR